MATAPFFLVFPSLAKAGEGKTCHSAAWSKSRSFFVVSCPLSTEV
jgi:hypothetical protein